MYVTHRRALQTSVVPSYSYLEIILPDFWDLSWREATNQERDERPGREGDCCLGKKS